MGEDYHDAVIGNFTEPDGTGLPEYVRQRLNLAISLACRGEQERRFRHWESAEELRRKWNETITEVKRLLPRVRKSGVSLFGSKPHDVRDGIQQEESVL